MEKFKDSVNDKFRKLVDTKFNGDEEAAIRYLYRNEPIETILYYLEHSPYKERKKIYLVYRDIMNEEYPGGYDTALKEENLSEYFNISIDEIRGAQTDVLREKLNGGFLKFLLGSGAYAAGYSATKGNSAYTVAAAGPASIVSRNLSKAIINYSIYKKLLKTYQKEEYKKQFAKYNENKEFFDKMVSLMDDKKVSEAINNGLKEMSL